MKRRDSLQKLVLGSAVLFLAPSVLQSCSKDDSENDPGTGPGPAPGQTVTVDLSLPDNAALNNTGGSKIVQSILIINTGTGFSALSSVCTHEGCTVGYNNNAGRIQCPCHGSEFNSSGLVLQGPASSPLEAYKVTRTGNILSITR